MKQATASLKAVEATQSLQRGTTDRRATAHLSERRMRLQERVPRVGTYPNRRLTWRRNISSILICQFLKTMTSSGRRPVDRPVKSWSEAKNVSIISAMIGRRLRTSIALATFVEIDTMRL